MAEHSYLAFAYRQSLVADAPYLLTFVAPVDAVHKWAGVPRRDRSDGFQRLDDPKRVKMIQEFLRLTENQSPTSIVVGVSKAAVEGGSVEVEPLWALEE